MFPIKDTIQSRRLPLVTWGIIVLNSAVFLYELTLPPERLESLVWALGMVPARLAAGDHGLPRGRAPVSFVQWAPAGSRR